MVRDFTDKAYEELIKKIDEINNINSHDALMDRLSSAPVISNMFSGDFATAFDELRNYQNLFLERLLFNKQIANRIFMDVEEVNFQYRKVFEDYKSDVTRQVLYFRMMKDAFGCSNGIELELSAHEMQSLAESVTNDRMIMLCEEYICGRLSSPSDVQMEMIKRYYDNELKALNIKYSGGVNIREIYKNDREKERLLVNLFRTMNPEIAKDIDTFFSSAEINTTPESQYADDIMNITYIAMSAKEPYKSLFFDVLDEVKLGVIDGYERDEYGNIRLDEDNQPIPLTSYFAGSEELYNYNTVNLNNSLNSTVFMDSERYPYSIFFHEMGHAIDYHAGIDSYYSLSTDVNLRKTIYGDVYSYIESRVFEAASDYHLDYEDIRAITFALINEDLAVMTSNEDWQNISNIAYKSLCGQYTCIFRDQLSNELSDYSDLGLLSIRSEESTYYDYKYKSEFKIWVNFDISDIFGALTNNYIVGRFGHENYYNNYSNSGQPNGGLELEATAHAFSMFITGNEERYMAWDGYLPNSLVLFESLFENMADVCID